MTFEEIVRKSQSELKKALVSELHTMGYQTITKHGFTYGAGSLPVLLVAHLDTVHREPVQTICYSNDGKIIMSPQGIGGDDRAGVFMTLQIIKEHRCHVLFCEDEEVGGIGAQRFVESGIQPEVNYMVELDRRGSNDAVFYDCDNPEFTDFVCRFGFEEEFGSFSDISILAPVLGVAAVNISTGYYNEHTLHEYVDMEAVRENIQRIGEMISSPSEVFEYIEYVSFRRDWFYNTSRWFGCEGNKEKEHIRQLKDAAEQFRISDYEVDLLLGCGYCIDDIELLLNSPALFRKAIYECIETESGL